MGHLSIQPGKVSWMSLDGSDSIELSIAESAKVPPSFDVYGTGRLEIGPYAVLEEGGAVFLGASGKGHVRLRARSYVKRGAILRTYEGRIEVGRRTTIGEMSVIAGHGGVTFGDDVIVSAFCYFNSADHIRMSPDYAVRFQGETAAGIAVREGAWIGTHCTVLDGVDIGPHSTLGAHSLLSTNTEANSTYAGVPARRLN